MTWLPRGLLARTLAVLAVTVGLSLIAIVLLVARERREFAIASSGMPDTAQRIAKLTRQLGAMPAADRAAAIRELESQREGAVFRPTPGGARDGAGRPPPRAISRTDWIPVYEAMLRRELGAGYRIEAHSVAGRSEFTGGASDDELIRLNVSPAPMGGPPRDFGPHRGDGGRGDRPDRGEFAGPGESHGPGAARARSDTSGPGEPRRGGGGRGPRLLDISVTGAGQAPLRFRVDAPRDPPPFDPALFWQIALIAGALAGALFLLMRSVTQPLRELATATDAVGRSLTPPRVEERGATEIRELIRGFNAMQDRLRRYVDSRTRTLAAMSHDLRTPLTRLHLRVESIGDEALAAKFRRDLTEMENLVTSALALFRGTGSDEPHSTVDLDALMAQIAGEFAESGHTVTLAGHAGSVLRGRPQSLKRALTNLIENAIKYGQRAAVQLERGSEWATIRVLDEGAGIPPQELEAIFEPFYRVESSRNRETGGTGLGLAIARDVVQAHGGSVVMQNRTDRSGAVAVVTLPHSSR
jgi:signal transduction histidine kinase